MRIISAGDSIFLGKLAADYGRMMDEDEFQHARYGNDPEVTPDDLRIEDHYDFDRARRMGFRPIRDTVVISTPRMYKVDRGMVTHILANPLTNIPSEDSGPQWVTTMHGTEYPEIRAMHNTLSDALDAHENGSWRGRHHEPVQYEHDAMRANPGQFYVSRFDSSHVPFEEAWEAGTDNPFDLKYRK